jgi:hypothetical protein
MHGQRVTGAQLIGSIAPIELRHDCGSCH